MKYFGSVSTYSYERAMELLDVYHDYIAACRHINCPEVLRHIVNMPTSRFFVSEERAAVVMARIAKGDRLTSMRPLKRKMFMEIHRRYKRMQRQHPDWNSLRCLTVVISQPAPMFYMSVPTARKEISKYKNEWYKKKLEKLLR